MKLIIICIVTLCSLCSCSEKLEISEPTSGSESVESLVRFNCLTSSSATKAISDSEASTIDNLNIFYYSEALGIYKHQYFDGTPAELMLLNSNWDIYFIANVGKSLSTLSLSEVKAYTSTITSEDDLKSGGGVVMTCYKNITISSDCYINVSLERVVAKVNLSVSLASSVQGVISITDIEIVNVPTSCSLFTPNSPTSSMSTYSKSCSSSGGDISFYMFENMQGENSAITTPENKVASKAPTNATYVLISAKSAIADIKYCIYLGENTTYSFDVCRNKEYNVDIVINGSNTDDLRVTLDSYELTISWSKALPVSIGWNSSSISVFKVVSADGSDISMTFKNVSGTTYAISVYNYDTWVEPEYSTRPDYSDNDYITGFSTTATSIETVTIESGVNYLVFITNVRSADVPLYMDMVFNEGLANELTYPIDIAYGF